MGELTVRNNCAQCNFPECRCSDEPCKKDKNETSVEKRTAECAIGVLSCWAACYCASWFVTAAASAATVSTGGAALIPLAIASGAAYAAERLFLGSSEKGLAKGADQYVRQGINAVKTARNVTGMVKGVLDQAALAV
jgi:hypothetical protein